MKRRYSASWMMPKDIIGWVFKYTTRRHLIRTTKIEIDLNEGQMEYIRRLASNGLWGNTVEDVIDRLICKGIEAEQLKGNVEAIKLERRA